MPGYSSYEPTEKDKKIVLNTLGNLEIQGLSTFEIEKRVSGTGLNIEKIRRVIKTLFEEERIKPVEVRNYGAGIYQCLNGNLPEIPFVIKDSEEYDDLRLCNLNIFFLTIAKELKSLTKKEKQLLKSSFDSTNLIPYFVLGSNGTFSHQYRYKNLLNLFNEVIKQILKDRIKAHEIKVTAVPAYATTKETSKLSVPKEERLLLPIPGEKKLLLPIPKEEKLLLPAVINVSNQNKQKPVISVKKTEVTF